MYNLHSFGHMIGDDVRIHAYAKALEHSVKPGMTVVDLGAGTGILSMLACRYGAAKVHAIELSDCASVGRELSAANGFADRIEWHHKNSFDVTLPERADLLVADLRGKLPFLRNNIATLADARDRFLAPAGVLIPQRDSCWVALAESPELETESVRPWKDNHFDFDWQPAIKRLSNRWHGTSLKPETLISDSAQWCSLDYRTISDPNAGSEVILTANRDATAHGFYVWFDAELTESVRYSGGPEGPSPFVYGAAFFPFSEAVKMSAGTTARIHISARFMDGDYIWAWRTQINEHRFRQSTFNSIPLDNEILRQAAKRIADNPSLA
jgi:type I protein arginine methyltransferase